MSGVEQHGRRATATSHSGRSRKRKQRNLQQAERPVDGGLRRIKLFLLWANKHPRRPLASAVFPVKFLGGPGVDTLAAAVAGQFEDGAPTCAQQRSGVQMRTGAEHGCSGSSNPGLTREPCYPRMGRDRGDFEVMGFWFGHKFHALAEKLRLALLACPRVSAVEAAACPRPVRTLVGALDPCIDPSPLELNYPGPPQG
jgi:hypothetical protein